MKASEISFTRYLAAKKSVDDRALNRGVIEALKAQAQAAKVARILELGAGVGVMFERLLEWGIPTAGTCYLGIDSDPQNVAVGARRLVEKAGNLTSHSTVKAALQTADALEFCRLPENQGTWDLLVAHAFLDLFDLPRSLPGFLQTLRPGGLAYFTINFDGETALEPVNDPALDRLIIELYHRSMDERLTNGLPSGDSRSGRHLFSLLPQNGLQVLAAGASDWVVYPQQGSYPADEAYFLHYILGFFEQSLSGHPDLDRERFAAWLQARHAQVERGELVFLAHQLDFVAQRRSEKAS